jgi:hypothetical protein
MHFLGNSPFQYVNPYNQVHRYFSNPIATENRASFVGKNAYSVMGELFSNQTEPVNGWIKGTVIDSTAQDTPYSRDQVELTASFQLQQNGDDYAVKFNNIIPVGNKFPFFGGVGMYKVIHGDTGIGTSKFPKVLAYVTLWGKADVYRNGYPVAFNRFIHVMVTQGGRDNETHNLLSSANIEPEDLEVHMILPGQEGPDKEPIPYTPDGFIHLFFEDVQLSTTLARS